MAYMSQQRKKELMPGIKAVLAKYGLKATVSVRHHSSLVVTIREGGIDFINSVTKKTDQWGNPNEFHYQVNTHWIKDHWESPAAEALMELKKAMSTGNWDNSDPYTDYFDVGWYTDINIGTWDKPYVLNPEMTKEAA